MKTQTPIRLKIEDATIGFDQESPLLESVDLEIRAGEIVGLTGRSGIGKTTLLRTAAGLVSPLSGSVECCCTVDTRAQKGAIGLIPQRLGLVQHQTVGYNVLMGALAGANFLQTALSLPSKKMREETRSAIEEVGLADKTLESVNRLSGGQQRRVAIARAMLQEPDLLLADECLGELDAETARGIIDLFRHMADDHNMAILIVDHNPVRAKTFCDRVYQLRGRRLIPFDEEEQSSVLPVIEEAST
jgi:ABC-type phosphate/phosphonate transport system ATPase subunit|tara:strand:+ start:72 stop:806 length:735 start_codon:yes stop_codon:yes gene_type:complete